MLDALRQELVLGEVGGQPSRGGWKMSTRAPPRGASEQAKLLSNKETLGRGEAAMGLGAATGTRQQEGQAPHAWHSEQEPGSLEQSPASHAAGDSTWNMELLPAAKPRITRTISRATRTSSS